MCTEYNLISDENGVKTYIIVFTEMIGLRPPNQSRIANKQMNKIRDELGEEYLCIEFRYIDKAFTKIHIKFKKV